MNIGKIFSSLSQEKKSALVFVFASALSSGLNIVTTPLFTRIMPVDEYGLVSLYNSWYQVLYVFASFSVTKAIANVGFFKYSEDRYGFLSSALGVTTFCSGIIAIVLILLRNVFCELTGFDTSVLVLMLLSFVGLTALNIWLVLQKYEFKYKAAFIVTVGTSVISTIVAVFAVLNAEHGYARIKLWTANFLQISAGFVLFAIILNKGKKFYNKEYWKFILVYNGPLLLHYLSQFILGGSDKIMIDLFEGEAKVAIYSLASSVAGMVLILWYPVNSVLIPYMHGCVREEKNEDLGKCFCDVLRVTGAVCVMVSLLAPEAIFILGDTEYMEGVYAVPVIAAGVFFTVFYNLIANVEFLFGKTHRIAFMTIAAAVLNVALNYLLIPKFGYIAAAYTTFIAYMVYASLHYINMRKQYQKKFVNGTALLLILGCTVVFCLSCVLLYETYLVRYVMTVGILVWLFLRMKKYLKGDMRI